MIKTNFKKKNILVLGGAGFIGSNLCAELLNDNQVICVDNFISSSVENIRFFLQNPNFEFLKHDINEPINLEELPELKKFNIKIQGIQEVYNLACPTSPKKFDNVVLETLLANSQGVKNVLDLVLKYDAKLLHLSSAVVYGSRKSDGYFVETDFGAVDFLSPRACYDEGKRFAETMIQTYGNYHKKNFKIARIFRTYGPNMMLNDGQMLPDFIYNALEGKDLVIYGDESFQTSLCYVSDIVQGLIKFMESSLSGPVNFGSSESILLSEVAKKIIELADSSSKIVYKAPLLFMTPLGLPDTTVAKDKLGWFPLVNLETGIQKTMDFTKANKQLLSSQFKDNI